jgi:hypothetical protein
MACAFDGSSDFALVFEGVTRDATREQFALFVDELEQKLGVFVVNMFDAELFEAAILFARLTEIRVAQKLNIIS